MSKRLHRTPASGLRHTIGDALHRTATTPAREVVATGPAWRSNPIRRADSDSDDAPDKPKDDSGGTDDKKTGDDDDDRKDTERMSAGPLYDGSEDS